MQTKWSFPSARAAVRAMSLTAALAALPGAVHAQSCVSTPAPAPCFTNIGNIPGTGTNSRAFGISADGLVVIGDSGNSMTALYQAFRWTAAGGLAGLGFVAGDNFSTASAVNSDGSVIVGGRGSMASPPPSGAFRWTSGGGMAAFGGAGDQVSGVSNDGTVISGTHNGQAARWVNGARTDLGFMGGTSPFSNAFGLNRNDGSIVVGHGSNASNQIEPFRWTPGGGLVGLGFLPGGVGGTAYGASADGSVIVGFSGATGLPGGATSDAFRYSNGTMTPLGCGTSAISGGEAYAANANGTVIVGTCNNSIGSGSQAMRWTAAKGVQSIHALLTAAGFDLTGWQLVRATGVSDDGTMIVGFGVAPGIPAPDMQAWVARLPVPTATATHDFNGDAKSDILWRDTSGNTAMWLMNGAAAVSTNASLGNVGTAWSVVGQRDFDGDGKHDILWRDSSGNTAIWLMNGTAVASVASLGNIGTAWSVAGTADFNGDGKGDILWRDSSGNVAMWLMNGGTVASNTSLGNIGTSWSVAGTGDFNGDGKADILWRDSSGNVAIWLMNGATVSSVASLGNIGAAWSVAGTGDFNGDGKRDIVWRNTGGDLVMWLMNGAAVSSSTPLGNVPTSWSIAQTGDYDGGGKSDILWRNSNGDTAMWLMNGAAVSSNVSLGNVGTAWAVQGLNAD